MLQIQPSKTRSDKLDNNSTTVQKSDRRTLKAAKAGKAGLALKAGGTTTGVLRAKGRTKWVGQLSTPAAKPRR